MSPKLEAYFKSIGLTKSETLVAELIVHGFSNAEIAVKIYVSIDTVRWHAAGIYSKSGFKSRYELIAHAFPMTLEAKGLVLPRGKR